MGSFAKQAKELTEGDYVLATKYSDGDPRDQWAIGWYAGCQGDRHFVTDDAGQQFRANGFRRVRRISGHQGAYLLTRKADIEMSSISLWGWLRRCPMRGK